MGRFLVPAVIFAVVIVTVSCSAFYTADSARSNSAASNSSTDAGPESGGGKAIVDQSIRKVDFKNFTYEPECAYEDKKKITVKNGEYSYEKPAEGYTDRFYFNIFEISYGDLNGDNYEEAIVLTKCNTGGTGNFTQGFVYTMKDGKPSLFANVPGGDRADGGLRTAKVDNGQLVVESNDPGPTGGSCCPEFIITTRYDVSTGKLKQVGKAEKRDLFPSQRVSFPKGTTGTSINIRLDPEAGKRFVVGARAGQTLDVSVNNSKASLRLLDDAEKTDNTDGFSAVLPKNGDYTIEVSNYETSAINVTLNIKIR